MKNHKIVFLLLFSFISSCGGGGGKFYLPSITYNPNNIEKVPLYNSELGIQNRQMFTETESNVSDDFYIGRIRFFKSKEISFNQQNLKIAIPLQKWISILNQKGDSILRLNTPRYAGNAVAIELNHPNKKPLLAILISQQPTSHSSTLYVLDSSFVTIYKEHHLGAYWVSKKTTLIGDKLLLSTEKSWNTPEGDLLIGGNWQYSFFGSFD